MNHVPHGNTPLVIKALVDVKVGLSNTSEIPFKIEETVKPLELTAEKKPVIFFACGSEKSLIPGDSLQQSRSLAVPLLPGLCCEEYDPSVSTCV